LKVVDPGQISLSLFFPVYNEEQNLEATAAGAVDALAGLGLKQFEVIIVDDGSADRTGPLADAIAARDPRVRVVRHPRNLGYGHALRAGFAAARYEYVFYTDGDRQYDLREIDRVIALIPYADLVIGFRTKKQYTPYRHLMSFTFNSILRLLFDIDETDIDCSFKLYPRSLFERIELTSVGAFIDAEVALRARELGLKTIEVGVTHFERAAGKSTAASPLAVLVVLREMWGHYRRYRRQGKL